MPHTTSTVSHPVPSRLAAFERPVTTFTRRMTNSGGYPSDGWRCGADPAQARVEVDTLKTPSLPEIKSDSDFLKVRRQVFHWLSFMDSWVFVTTEYIAAPLSCGTPFSCAGARLLWPSPPTRPPCTTPISTLPTYYVSSLARLRLEEEALRYRTPYERYADSDDELD